MTLPFVRARWQNFLPKATESPTTTEIIRAQKPQQKPGDTLIHELRLVVRRSYRAPDIPIRSLSWEPGCVYSSGLLRCRYTHVPVFPWTSISRNFYGVRLTLELLRGNLFIGAEYVTSASQRCREELTGVPSSGVLISPPQPFIFVRGLQGLMRQLTEQPQTLDILLVCYRRLVLVPMSPGALEPKVLTVPNPVNGILKTNRGFKTGGGSHHSSSGPPRLTADWR